MTEIFCASCAAFHEGEISLVDCWPTVRWSEAHDPDAAERQRHLAAIAQEGGKALALVLDAGDWARVEEVLSAVLELNDPKPEDDRP